MGKDSLPSPRRRPSRWVVWFLAGFSGVVLSAQREIASRGDELRMLMDDPYECAATVPFTIETKSAEYYDQDAATLQRLVINTAGVILGFECPQARTIEFRGHTDGVLVFRADASKKTRWKMESYPPPLEMLSLFLSVRAPAFEHFISASTLLQKYRSVNGIEKTHQYKALLAQAARMASTLDSTASAFTEYLKDPAGDFVNFDEAQSHYRYILDTLAEVAPEHEAAHRAAYANRASHLREDFWYSRLTTIIGVDKSVPAIVASARNEISHSTYQEYKSFIDRGVAFWVNDDMEMIKSDLPDLSINEIALLSDYFYALPEASVADGLPATQEAISRSRTDLLSTLLERVRELRDLAIGLVKESGNHYLDVHNIVEVGVALAEEFASAGYDEESESIIQETNTYVASVLEAGIYEYRASLTGMAFTSDAVNALQDQFIVFEELSKDIPGYTPYYKAAEDTLNNNKAAICAETSDDIGIDESQAGLVIDTPDGAITLLGFACRVLENKHRVTQFSRERDDNHYVLSIEHKDGDTHSFLLEKQSHSPIITVTHQTSPDAIPVDNSYWREYVYRLLLPPVTGEPDEQGVRECDQLAADPKDRDRLSPGVDFSLPEYDQTKLERAIDACIAAIENDDSDPRSLYQLGRTLWYAGEQSDAEGFINAAADKGYGPALYYKAEILLSTSEEEDAFIDALALFEQAGEKGYLPGKEMVQEMNPEGVEFFKEIPPPTPSEIRRGLTNRKIEKKVMGIGAKIEVVGVTVKECFQTNATDFSCEYRKTLECGLLGRDDPAIRMMDWALKHGCKNSQYTFGTFRRTRTGSWKEIPSSP